VLAKAGPAAKQRRKGNDWKNDFFQGFSSEALQHLEDSFDLHGAIAIEIVKLFCRHESLNKLFIVATTKCH